MRELVELRQRVAELEAADAKRKQAEGALRRRVEELAALQATVLEITAPHDLPTLLATIIERAALLLNAMGGGLYLCDPDKQEVRCVVSYNTLHDYTGTVLKYGEGAAGTVAKTGEPLVIDDYRTWNRRADVYEDEQPFTAVLSAPMIWQGQVTGVIHVLHNVENRRFTPADLELLTLFANHAAIAVENARLYEAAQQELAERKQAEGALREAEERFRSIFRNTVIGLYRTTPDGRITLANPALVRMLGYSSFEELAQRNLEQGGFNPEYPRSVFKQRIDEEGHVTGLEAVWLKRDGARLFVRESAKAVRDDTGNILHYEGTVEDITERKQREEEIRQRTAQLEALRQVGLEITAQLELESLLHSIVSRAIELVGATSGGLYLYRPERDVLEWSVTIGPNLGPVGAILHRGEGLSGKVWDTGEPLIIGDYRQWEGRLTGYEDYTFGAIMGVPVRWGEELLGVLDLLADPPRTFSPADAELLSLFATQAAIAIRNVRFLESEREQRALTSALEEAAAIITSTLDPALVLDRILEQVSRVVPNDASNVMLIEGDEVHVARWRGYERFGVEEFVPTIVFRIPEARNFQQMLETAEPMVIPETATYPGWIHMPPQEWLQSYAAAPIIVRGEVIGFLNVDSATPGFFAQDDAEALRAFAGHAAAAIENARLYAAQQQRAQESSLLLDVANTINSTLDMTGVLSLVTQRAAQACGANRCTILLLDERGETLTPTMSQFASGTVDKEMWQLFQDIRYPTSLSEVPEAQKALQEGRPLFIPDALASSLPRNWIEPFDMRSLLAVPMTSKGRPIGLMVLDHMEEGKGFTDEQVDLGMIIGTQAAIAIENARLYEEAKGHSDKLAALYETGKDITLILEVDALLQLVAKSSVRLTGADKSLILLVDTEAERLIKAVGCGFAPGQTEDFTYQEVHDGISGWVLNERTPTISEDILTDPRNTGLALQKALNESEKGRSIAVAPLLIGDRVIGTLTAIKNVEKPVFSQDDLGLVTMLASQAAIAIGNARLYQQAQREIAERRRAQKELRESEEMYRTLVQTSPDAVTVSDLEGYITYVSQRTLELHGFESDEELLGKSAFELIAPEDHQRAITNLEKTLEEGRLRSEEYVFLRKGGARFVGELSAALIRDASGNPKTFMATTRDITERKQAETALVRRATQLAAVNKIGQQIASILEPDELLGQIAALLEEAFGYRYIYVFLTSQDSKELVLRAGAGSTGRVLEGTRLAIDGRSLNAYVARTGQPLLVNDVSQQPMYLLLEEVADTKSELVVPIKVKDQVIGTLDVQSMERNAFDESDLSTLQTLADQAAIAIETARLFAETEARANDLALLLGTSTAISSTLDPDQILETVAQQVTTSLAATFCRISLLDQTGEHLVVRAASPIRDQKAVNGFGQRYPLSVAPWHMEVIKTGKPLVLREDVPGLTMSNEERKMALTEDVKSAALIPLIVGGRVLGVISLGEERSWQRSPFTAEKVELCQSIAAQAAVAIENANLYDELEQSFIQTIAALAATVDAKDSYTGGHSQRTTELATTIAQELGLSDEDIELTHYAGLLHDVGKIGIDEQILSKPGSLNEKEWEIIREHPALGASIVERAASLEKLVPVILHHHEHYNGQGYPDGLRGEDIPLKARILAVADAYEAMTSDRAYRPAMSVEQALATLLEGAGKQWDGEVVEVLHRIIRGQGLKDWQYLEGTGR